MGLQASAIPYYEQIARSAILFLFCTMVSICAYPQSAPSVSPSLPILEHAFKSPPDDARIMMRWWWFGPAVDKGQPEREMLRRKEGGVGGFEVHVEHQLSVD